MKASRTLVAASFLVCLTACGSPALLALNPASSIEGQRVNEYPLVVRQSFMASIGGTDFAFPAGSYRAAFEDASGVYFRADAPVVMQDALFGSSLRVGGVYVARSSWRDARPYLVQPAGNTTLLDRTPALTIEPGKRL